MAVDLRPVEKPRMPSVSASLTWLRRNLAWSNSRQSWQERLGVLFLLAGAALLWTFSAHLSLSQEVLFASLLLVALAVLLRRGWLKLFGPVLFYDLVRIGRRGRHFLFRTLYALALTLLLGWVYAIGVMESNTPGTLPANEMADFAATFFYCYVGVQFAAVVILTPAFTAGAIAEEKDRKTLEFLLATDLRNREIVLSKLAARLATLALLVLVGLPILSLIQLLGGVDPNLLLAAFAVTGLTLASLAGLSILASVWARRPRDAIALTYLTAFAYLLLSGMSWLLLVPSLGLATPPSAAATSGPGTVESLVRGFNAGNPIAALILLEEQIGSGSRLDAVLPAAVRDYALFHGLVAVVCAAWAVLRLRAIALRQLYAQPAKRRLAVRVWGRPRMGKRPMLWKELYVEGVLGLPWLGRLAILLLVLACFAPAVWLCAMFLAELFGTGSDAAGSAGQELAQAMNVWVRIAGTLVACLLLLAVAVRAASSISGERDRQTLDALLTSPLEANTILFAKWAGSIGSVRWGWLWLGLIWGLGLATGGLFPGSVLLLPAAWLVYAAFAAVVGLWFSMTCRTSLRATVWTLGTLVTVSVGHWFVMTMCFYMPISLLTTGVDEQLEWVPQFQLLGLTPPFTLGFLAFQGWEFEERSWLWNPEEMTKFTFFALIGLACWALAAMLVWMLASSRFRVVAARVPLTRPPADGGRGSTPVLTPAGSDSHLAPEPRR